MLQSQLAAGASLVTKQFEYSVEDLQPHDIPPPDLPDKDMMLTYGGMFQTLQAWYFAGAVTPFEWAALKENIGDQADVIAVARVLLGSACEKWFTAIPPTMGSVVPRQVALLMLHCLTQVRVAFEDELAKETMVQMATEGVAAVRASGKRLRVSPPSEAQQSA